MAKSMQRRSQQATKTYMLAQRQGQSAALAVIDRWLSGSRITRTHPLEFIGMFDYKGRDNRFGNIHTYKCNTKTLSSLLVNAQFVPHTNVQFVSDTTARLMYPVPVGTARVCSVLWVRRHKVRELEDAVATLLMMGHEHIVAVRSFDPP